MHNLVIIHRVDILQDHLHFYNMQIHLVISIVQMMHIFFVNQQQIMVFLLEFNVCQIQIQYILIVIVILKIGIY
jgi:hypothetical protein